MFLREEASGRRLRPPHGSFLDRPLPLGECSSVRDRISISTTFVRRSILVSSHREYDDYSEPVWESSIHQPNRRSYIERWQLEGLVGTHPSLGRLGGFVACHANTNALDRSELLTGDVLVHNEPVPTTWRQSAFNFRSMQAASAVPTLLHSKTDSFCCNRLLCTRRRIRR